MKFSLSSLVIPPWVKIVAYVLPWAIALGLFVGLGATRATLREVRLADKLLASQSETASKTQELGWAQKLSQAQSGYLDALKNLSTIKDKSDEDTRTFATTPAGATPCLSLDRVRAALSHRSDLASATAAEGSSGEVPSGSDPATQPIGK